jgi:hypothetical protein
VIIQKLNTASSENYMLEWENRGEQNHNDSNWPLQRYVQEDIAVAQCVFTTGIHKLVIHLCSREYGVTKTRANLISSVRIYSFWRTQVRIWIFYHRAPWNNLTPISKLSITTAAWSCARLLMSTGTLLITTGINSFIAICS